jgi:Asp-tRNA(Asn)/Glu-tRNA(Gln) amidotransferase A subunit family amidase
MNNDDALALSACEQARLIRGREVSSRELVDASLARIAALDGELGAFLAVDVDGARRAAAHADEQVARGDDVGPLHGVPLCVKDLIDTAGLTTTHGSALFEHDVPSADAPAVARLRAAGAVVVGKTNTPEFGLAAETITTFGPVAKNPWNPARTTGGSSGGTAAAIAAGMTSAGLGSDAGGSIRLPAAWCGVLGLKPTYGRVPVNPKREPADHPSETVGPMARSVDDLALLLELVAGVDRADPTSLPLPVPRYTATLRDRNRPLRVRFGLDLGMGPVDEPIAAALLNAMKALEADDAQVDECEALFDERDRHPFLIMFDLIAGSVAGRFADISAHDWSRLADYSRTFIEAGRELRAADYVRAVYAAKRVRAAVDRALDGYDVLALPATAVVAWPHGEPPALVAGSPANAHGGITYGGLPFLALASISGHPAMSVPCGFDPDGMPVGLQLVARYFDEETLLLAAARCVDAVDVSILASR